ncbi:hypothetical protein BJX61DRAFT_12295 [Aspergillus egyptiacus]|nr:hypothetical protein BJX61DRAFT_12295 [Aspergillus egyptiacus]
MSDGFRKGGGSRVLLLLAIFVCFVAFNPSVSLPDSLKKKPSNTYLPYGCYPDQVRSELTHTTTPSIQCPPDLNSNHRISMATSRRPGRRGGNTAGREDTRKTQRCRDFTKGRCKFGDKCVYIHDIQETPEVRSTGIVEECPARDAYGHWKRRLKHYLEGASPNEVRRFWDGALTIDAFERLDLLQNIPRDLIDGDGAKGLHGLSECGYPSRICQ